MSYLTTIIDGVSYKCVLILLDEEIDFNTIRYENGKYIKNNTIIGKTYNYQPYVVKQIYDYRPFVILPLYLLSVIVIKRYYPYGWSNMISISSDKIYNILEEMKKKNVYVDISYHINKINKICDIFDYEIDYVN
jgi:hypothetical protein